MVVVAHCMVVVASSRRMMRQTSRQIIEHYCYLLYFLCRQLTVLNSANLLIIRKTETQCHSGFGTDFFLYHQLVKTNGFMK